MDLTNSFLVRPKPFWTDQNCFGHIEGQGSRMQNGSFTYEQMDGFNFLPICGTGHLWTRYFKFNQNPNIIFYYFVFRVYRS